VSRPRVPGWVTDHVRTAHEAVPSGLPFWRVKGRVERDGVHVSTVSFPAVTDEEAAMTALRRLRSGEDPGRDSLREGERWASFELERFEPWTLVFHQAVQP
jgi:hypothetical protein